MKVLRTANELRKELALFKGDLGFVPTLGGLHEGHLSLIKKSQVDNEATMVSLFLNPTQFNDPNDLKTYPHSTEDDLRLLENQGVNWVFLPEAKDMYPQGYRFEIHEKEISQKFCGQSRPGHFSGVLTVVMKLLQLVSPKRAYFGEKDFQQLQLIKALVDDFFMDTEIVPCPIVRDEYGLAQSSRNRKLTELGIEKARFFAQSLQNTQLNQKELWEKLTQEGVKVDYIEDWGQRRLAAVSIENVRLIDNVAL